MPFFSEDMFFYAKRCLKCFMNIFSDFFFYMCQMTLSSGRMPSRTQAIADQWCFSGWSTWPHVSQMSTPTTSTSPTPGCRRWDASCLSLVVFHGRKCFTTLFPCRRIVKHSQPFGNTNRLKCNNTICFRFYLYRNLYSLYAVPSVTY